MKVIAIENISRKDVPIYYRLVYAGVAVIELFNGVTGDYRIDFSIETTPLGEKQISVSLRDGIDYPLLPVLRELKKAIRGMHNDGELPD